MPYRTVNTATGELLEVADSAQRGSIVSCYFDAIVFGVMSFINLFLVAAVVAIAVYTVR